MLEILPQEMSHLITRADKIRSQVQLLTHAWMNDEQRKIEELLGIIRKYANTITMTITNIKAR